MNFSRRLTPRVFGAAVVVGLWVLISTTPFSGGCDQTGENGGGTTGGGTTGGATGGTTGGTTGGAGALIQFTPVGEALASDLIDLEFLPGQGGEAIVIGKGGTVYYMRNDFTFLSDHPTVSVEDGGEQGLLNVETDPDYDANGFIYLFFTLPDGSGNRVQRFMVTVNVLGDSFSIAAGPVLATALKSDSPDPGTNHNGGGLAFDGAGNLYIGFGDGGGSASSLGNAADMSQNPSTFLGKIIRVMSPSATPSATVFALGLRNPFTMAFGNGGIFIGDVGSDFHEEINFAPTAAVGINFGWDETEGPTTEPGFTTPLHSYAHGDFTFEDEDPEPGNTSSRAVMAGAFYTGSQYDGLLTGRFFYSEFYGGWVRSFLLDGDGIADDQHMGHNAGMTSIQEGPDGFLYAVSLFGADRLLRVDLQ